LKLHFSRSGSRWQLALIWIAHITVFQRAHKRNHLGQSRHSRNFHHRLARRCLGLSWGLRLGLGSSRLELGLGVAMGLLRLGLGRLGLGFRCWLRMGMGRLGRRVVAVLGLAT